MILIPVTSDLRAANGPNRWLRGDPRCLLRPKMLAIKKILLPCVQTLRAEECGRCKGWQLGRDVFGRFFLVSSRLVSFSIIKFQDLWLHLALGACQTMPRVSRQRWQAMHILHLGGDEVSKGGDSAVSISKNRKAMFLKIHSDILTYSCIIWNDTSRYEMILCYRNL